MWAPSNLGKQLRQATEARRKARRNNGCISSGSLHTFDCRTLHSTQAGQCTQCTLHRAQISAQCTMHTALGCITHCIIHCSQLGAVAMHNVLHSAHFTAHRVTSAQLHTSYTALRWEQWPSVGSQAWPRGSSHQMWTRRHQESPSTLTQCGDASNT